MTTKSDFTPVEWATLRQAPPDAAAYIIVADPSILSTFVEIRLVNKALNVPSAPPAAEELVEALAADLEAGEASDTGTQAVDESEDLQQRLLDTVRGAAAVVDAKCATAEAEGFKQWLLDLARVAAYAHKEGGILGIGGVPVSEKEKAALAELESALGL